MKLPRRQFLDLAAGAAALPAVSRMASAQTYPVASVSKDGRHRPQQVAPTGDKSFGALQNVARRKTVGMENVL
jgi:hypothetical protein